MVVINIDNVVHILHIHPFLSESLFFTINKFKEIYIKLELFLGPLILKFL